MDVLYMQVTVPALKVFPVEWENGYADKVRHACHGQSSWRCHQHTKNEVTVHEDRVSKKIFIE